jgi:hypothetical protein
MLENPKAFRCLLCKNLEDEMENEMGNQQQRLKLLLDLAWLGGVIDGEGTFTLRYHNVKNNKRNNIRLHILPVFSITNTDYEIVDNIVRIFKENGIPFWQSENKNEGHNNWKPSREIQIQGVRRLNRVIPILLPYLVGKKEEAKIVYDFCKHRLELLGNHSYYTEEDMELVKKVKALHGHKQFEYNFKMLNDYTLDTSNIKVKI